MLGKETYNFKKKVILQDIRHPKIFIYLFRVLEKNLYF